MGYFPRAVHPYIHLGRLFPNGRTRVNDDQARYRWVAMNILPCEGEVRAWLRRNVHTLDRADIDDFIQEAYARLWDSDFTRITNGRSYFYTIVRNVLLEHVRRARIVPMERLGEIEALRIVSDEPGPESQATVRQQLERLWRAIGALPTQCRVAFRLRTFEARSRREIAQQMGISERTVEKHLAKALLRVAAELQENGGISDGSDAAHRTMGHEGSH
jgi:RNA polymerase sigma factor (sigma-70 family)